MNLTEPQLYFLFVRSAFARVSKDEAEGGTSRFGTVHSRV